MLEKYEATDFKLVVTPYGKGFYTLEDPDNE